MIEMEAKVELRVAGVEKQVVEAQERSAVLETKVEQLEAALKDLTQMVKSGQGPRNLGDDVERRRSTLVFGGWPKDSRRVDILADLKEALPKLGLATECDESPFCTGPRRSIALLSVPLRAMETEQGRRARMFKFVSAFQGHEVSSKSGTKLWCNFSKSPKERAIAAHASLVKRVVAHFDGEIAANQLDFEYRTGSVWGPQAMMASALLPHPPGVAAKHILVDEDSDHKHWIDVSQVAKLVNKTAKQIRDVYGWNVGGADISDLAKAVCEGIKRPMDPDAVVILQELPRGASGWCSEKQGLLEVVSHRSETAWRGTGLAYRTDSWSVVRRVARARGCWILLKHLKHGTSLWCATAHFTPGCTQAQYEGEVTNFFEGMPKGSVPVVCQFDANAPISWNQFDGAVLAVGRDGKANEALGQVESRGLSMIPPGPSQFQTPTSRPRQEGRRGSIIDYMATRGVRRARETVHVDSCHVLGTDHELLQGELELSKGEATRRAPTAPRVWRGGVTLIEHLDQPTLVHLARRCTVPAKGRGYKDPREVKEAVARARLLRTKASWCAVRSLRKNARKVWETQRVERASQGDWGAFRDVKPKIQSGWQHSFANAQVLDPHTVIHDHLQSVYQGRGVKPNKGVYEGEVTAFSEEELRVALSQMKRCKSVGVDGTSTELLQALVEVDGGCTHLLEFMNRTLATQQIPKDWNTPLMVLLPKILEPLDGHALLQSPWGSSMVEMTQGIKQGAVESPGFFSMIAEVCFQEAGARFGWDKLPSAFEGLPFHDVLFMDDGFMWSSGVQGVQQKVRQLMVVLEEFGLKLNGSKCQLLCSPHWKGEKAIWIAGSRVEASPEVEVMGLPMRVGMTMSELVAPLVARARSKFWSMHHVFRSKTSLKGRLQTLATAVGNAALWCLSSFPPEKPAMGMLNTMQMQLTIWAMRLSRRVGESMGDGGGMLATDRDAYSGNFHQSVHTWMPFEPSNGLVVVQCFKPAPPRDLPPDFPDLDRLGPGLPAGADRKLYPVPIPDYRMDEAPEGRNRVAEQGSGIAWDDAGRDGDDSPLYDDARRMRYPRDIPVGTTDRIAFGTPFDGVIFMQSSSGAAPARGTRKRADRPCEEWVDDVTADFRQLVDQGQGRMARRSLMMALQRRCHATPTDLAGEVLGETLADDSPLPMRARRYPVDMESWVHRVTQELERCARECILRRPRLELPANPPDPERPFGIFHPAHVWRDGTYSTAEDLRRMAREDLLARNQGLPADGVDEAGEEGEPDEGALFQTGMDPRPTRRWEDLIEQFWVWWEEERATGIAIMMLRRLAQSRADAAYRRWVIRPCNTLGAGIPNSAGETEDTSPADFMQWAIEAEETLYAIFNRETDDEGEQDGDATGFMERERGRRGGERHRGRGRSRSMTRHAADRDRPRGRERGRDEPDRGGLLAGLDLLRAQVLVEMAVEVGDGGVHAGEPRFDDFNATMLFFPTGPHDSDAGVDIWRYLLGIGTSDLPRGREVIGAGGPLIPDNRADWMVEVLREYTTQQQMLMTIALVTTVRALLTELGQIMHQASLVEVNLDEEPAGERGREGHDGDEEDTGLMQLGAVMLVHGGYTVTYGIMQSLQKELEGPSPGLARLRALNMRKQLRELRAVAKVEERELADQLDALCVVTAEAGKGHTHDGFLASEEQLNAWTWAWFLKLVPKLKLRGRRASGSGDPIPPVPVVGDSQSSTARSQSTICPTLVALGEHEQFHERRDARSLEEAQARYEEEEDQFYKGVEKAVEEHMRIEESRNYQAWEDWAMHDEMNGPRARAKRRRLQLEVTVGPRPGQPGTAQTIRVPWTSDGSQVMITMQTKVESGDEDEEDATTVKASPHKEEGDAVIPMEFGEFMDLFEKWSQGEITSDSVRQQFGSATLDMLETQLVVKEGALEEGEREGTLAAAPGGVGPVSDGQTGHGGEVRGSSSVPSGSLLEMLGLNASQRADTMLDAVLSCTPGESAETLQLGDMQMGAEDGTDEIAGVGEGTKALENEMEHGMAAEEPAGVAGTGSSGESQSAGEDEGDAAAAGTAPKETPQEEAASPASPASGASPANQDGMRSFPPQWPGTATEILAKPVQSQTFVKESQAERAAGKKPVCLSPCCTSFPCCTAHCPITFCLLVFLGMFTTFGVFWRELAGINIVTDTSVFLEADSRSNAIRAAYLQARPAAQSRDLHEVDLVCECGMFVSF
ncbi:unnamed protein product [Symbiodinium sp. CCMP2592]|nr:unnamed protein product [Symbiodinium sp. CCMP2592]